MTVFAVQLSEVDITSIWVATVGAIAVVLPVWWKIGRLDRNNGNQHNEVATLVRSLHSTVGQAVVTVDGLLTSQEVAKFVNDPHGVLIDCNNEALTLLGVTDIEPLKENPIGWIEFIHPDDRDLVTRNWLQAISTEQRQPAIEYRYVNLTTKRVTTVRSTVAPVHGPKGEVEAWVSVVTTLGVEDPPALSVAAEG